MSREAFEKWASGSFYLQKETSWYGDTPLETYQHDSTQAAWDGWQAAKGQAGSLTKNQISESIFGWGLRNDDGHNLSMDDTDEIAEYIMKQSAQAQTGDGFNQQLLEALLDHFVAARFAIDTGMKGTALNCINAGIAAIAAAQEQGK
jgi:hypothetical protein